jgi:hypothetical protein
VVCLTDPVEGEVYTAATSLLSVGVLRSAVCEATPICFDEPVGSEARMETYWKWARYQPGLDAGGPSKLCNRDRSREEDSLETIRVSLRKTVGTMMKTYRGLLLPK